MQKCKCAYEVSVEKEEMEAVMTEEERIKETKKEWISIFANNLFSMFSSFT